MKYLIDHRYKKIHSVVVTVNTIIQICRRGQSGQLSIYLTELHDHLTSLDVLKSPPFNQDQIKAVCSLEDSIKAFLHLPEDMLEKGEGIVESCKELLQTIDPFTFSFDDSLGIRRSQIVEFTKELQMYLKASLLQLQGLATSIMDEKSAIEEIMADLSRVSQEKFKKEEENSLFLLKVAFDEFEKEASFDTIQNFYARAIELESTFLS